jgi:hypothetical protein
MNNLGTVPAIAVRHGADVDARSVSNRREPHPDPESGGPQGAARLPRPAVSVAGGCEVYLRGICVGLLSFLNLRQSPGHGTWACAVAACCRAVGKTYTPGCGGETPHIPPIVPTRHETQSVSFSPQGGPEMCQYVPKCATPQRKFLNHFPPYTGPSDPAAVLPTFRTYQR